MNPTTLTALLALINAAIALGGEIVPIALKAFNAIKAETGMTDAELAAAAEDLNAADKQKLADLLASLT
jgi:hypothetical protein